MARDFEDIHDLGDLGDRELRDLIVDHFRDTSALDADDITVRVHEGRVVLEGRVGTDGEKRIAEHVLTDVVGVSDFENGILVDPLRRARSSEDAEENLNQEQRTEGLLLGDRSVPLEPESEDREEDLDARLFGTTDVQKAIGDATSWIPPESPTQEGFDGADGQAGGEDH